MLVHSTLFTDGSTQIDLINAPWLWLICLLIIVIASVGTIFGRAFTVRALGESWHDAFCWGTLMNTRGLVELIVRRESFKPGQLPIIVSFQSWSQVTYLLITA